MHDSHWVEGWWVMDWINGEIFTEFVSESEGVVSEGDGV